jgi:hypothetical protein
MVRCGGQGAPAFFAFFSIRRTVPRTARPANLRANHIAIAVAAAFAPWSLQAQTPPAPNTVVQTGNLAIGSASAEQSTVVSAAGDISMSASGQILVRGSDTTAGASSEVRGGGDLDFSAGSVALVGGAAPESSAWILGYSDINLTVGGFITLGAGTGLDSWARVQTASRDSVITLNFPNLASGGYFVNGIEGLLRDGHTGFLSGTGVAAPGHQLITIYGAP